MSVEKITDSPAAPLAVRSGDLFDSQAYDAAYQQFVEESAKHCRCQAPHPCPCDGVLAGGICDEMTNEPDYTLDDLDWHETYD